MVKSARTPNQIARAKGRMSNRLSVQAYLGAAWLFMLLIPVQFYFFAAGSFSNLTFSPSVSLGFGLNALTSVLILISRRSLLKSARISAVAKPAAVVIPPSEPEPEPVLAGKE